MEAQDASSRSHSTVLSRVAALAQEAGMDYARFGPHDLLFPHPPLGETRVSMDPKGEPVLRFYTTHHGLLGFGEIPDLSEFVNDWNHDCLSPRLVLNYASPEEVEVWGHTFLVVHHTPTAAQLEASVLPALSNAQAFLEALVDYFPLLTQVKRGSALLAAEEESAEDTASTVLPVDVPRLEKLLPALGIIRFQSDSDEVVYAWINDVLFAFVIESGPSLLIKGHWDPDFPGSEFSKIFLICNDWNRKNHSASAFCHSNMDGLQVRLDYPVITAAGLSDAQLVTALGRSIKHILHGIDDIATEAVGSSPVQWP